ncbi:MAG: hypothetical protein WC093_00945 [Methanoculleus sp.]|jgi:hypothetical protein
MKKTQQKNSKDETTPWMKWAYVGVALVVAVAMVGSYLAPMLGSSQKAQEGNMAQVGYTLRNEDGRPIVTTNPDLLSSEYAKGNLVFLTPSLEMLVGGQVSGENVAPVPILYPETNGTVGFGILGFETNAIAAALVGMRPGETRTIDLDYGTDDLDINLSAEEANGIDLNFTEMGVGDLFLREFMISSGIPVGNETNMTPTLRFWEVADKTDDSLLVTCRYGSAEITLNAISG